MLMIPIDTGNKAIKTENFEFHSGITALESMPGENEEALMFQDKYYRLSHERNAVPRKDCGSTCHCSCSKSRPVRSVRRGGFCACKGYGMGMDGGC